MSRFLFRLVADAEPWEVEDAWSQSPARSLGRLWINKTDRLAILHAYMLDDDPCAWWHEPGGGCIYFQRRDERAGIERFFELYRDLFDRVEIDSG